MSSEVVPKDVLHTKKYILGWGGGGGAETMDWAPSVKCQLKTDDFTHKPKKRSFVGGQITGYLKQVQN